MTLKDTLSSPLSESPQSDLGPHPGTPIAPPLEITPYEPSQELLDLLADDTLSLEENSLVEGVITRAKVETVKALPFGGAYKLSKQTATRLQARWRRRHLSETKMWPSQKKARARAKRLERYRAGPGFADMCLTYQFYVKPNRPPWYHFARLRDKWRSRLRLYPNLEFSIDKKDFEQWLTTTLYGEGIATADVWIREPDWRNGYHKNGKVGVRVTKGPRKGEEYWYQ